MTLNITVFSDFGMWQSTDHRVTRREGAKYVVVDDLSNKYVDVLCIDGRASIIYAGLGMVGRQNMTFWLRSVLTRINGSVGAYVQHVAAAATAEFGSLLAANNIFHVFTVGAYIGNQPHLFFIANSPDPLAEDAHHHLERRFSVDHWDIKPPAYIAVGSGARGIDDKQLARLVRISRTKPRRTDDFHDLLADVNLRLSESPQTRGTVSPGCHTFYLPSTGEGGEGRFHGPESMPSEVLFQNLPVFQGIDFGGLLASTWRQQGLQDSDKRQAEPHPDPLIRRKVAKHRRKRAWDRTTRGRALS